MQKSMRKKNRNKTKIAPSQTQKTLKNQRKINRNQQITKSHFVPIWAPKTLQNGTPKRPKNDQKNMLIFETIFDRKKCENRRKKPDLAVNGKRCIQTLFVI